MPVVRGCVYTTQTLAFVAVRMPKTPVVSTPPLVGPLAVVVSLPEPPVPPTRVLGPSSRV